MKAFVIEKGTEVFAVNISKDIVDKKITKKESMYFLEDIEFDPVGKIACHTGNHTIGGKFARDGFYGFKLPNNKSGYETMLVHMNDVIVN